MTRLNRFLKVTTSAISLLLAGAAVATPTEADAASWTYPPYKKVWPGTICQIWGPHKAYSHHLSYSQFGRVTNTHTTKKLGVVCPIMRSNPLSAPNFVRVYAYDGHFTGGGNGVFKCTLRAMNVWGTTSTSSATYQTSSSGGTKSIHHEFNVSTNNRNSEFNEPGFTMLCEIPPRDPNTGRYSYVGSIVIDEPHEP